MVSVDRPLMAAASSSLEPGLGHPRLADRGAAPAGSRARPWRGRPGLGWPDESSASDPAEIRRRARTRRTACHREPPPGRPRSLVGVRGEARELGGVRELGGGTLDRRLRSHRLTEGNSLRGMPHGANRAYAMTNMPQTPDSRGPTGTPNGTQNTIAPTRLGRRPISQRGRERASRWRMRTLRELGVAGARRRNGAFIVFAVYQGHVAHPCASWRADVRRATSCMGRHASCDRAAHRRPVDLAPPHHAARAIDPRRRQRSPCA